MWSFLGAPLLDVFCPFFAWLGRPRIVCWRICRHCWRGAQVPTGFYYVGMFDGGGIANVNTVAYNNAASPVDCGAACRTTSGCAAFAYVITRAASGNCWLKSDNANLVSSSSVMYFYSPAPSPPPSPPPPPLAPPPPAWPPAGSGTSWLTSMVAWYDMSSYSSATGRWQSKVSTYVASVIGTTPTLATDAAGTTGSSVALTYLSGAETRKIAPAGSNGLIHPQLPRLQQQRRQARNVAPG